MDVSRLTELLRDAEEHHGTYEATAPEHHWSDWYAAYIIAREQGRTPEEAVEEGKLRIEGTGGREAFDHGMNRICRDRRWDSLTR